MEELLPETSAPGDPPTEARAPEAEEEPTSEPHALEEPPAEEEPSTARVSGENDYLAETDRC